MTKEEKIEFVKDVKTMYNKYSSKRIKKELFDLLKCLFYEEVMENTEIGISKEAEKLGVKFQGLELDNNLNYTHKKNITNKTNKHLEWEHYLPLEVCKKKIFDNNDYSVFDEEKFTIITEEEHKRIHSLDSNGEKRTSIALADKYYNDANVEIKWYSNKSSV